MPRLLDLFCGAGGAAVGYSRAGFEVVGVDVEPQPDYPFEFHQADAMVWLRDPDLLRSFDAIHASPPCQGESSLRRLRPDKEYERLLVPTLLALRSVSNPWVVENVDNAVAPVEFPKIRLCGSSFGLLVRRHRWFWTNVPIEGSVCRHEWQRGKVVGVYGNSDGPAANRVGKPKRGPRQVTTDEARDVMGMPWVGRRRGLTEAIPPAYTEFVGRQLLPWVEVHRRARAGRR